MSSLATDFGLCGVFFFFFCATGRAIQCYKKVIKPTPFWCFGEKQLAFPEPEVAFPVMKKIKYGFDSAYLLSDSHVHPAI